jgi:ABC-type transport system substrate-binding protein
LTIGHDNYGYFSDPEMVEIYNRMLKETDVAKARALMRKFETRINDQAHQLMVTYWYRIVPSADPSAAQRQR